MKNNFEAEIRGKGFFKTFILFYIPILILAAGSTALNESVPALSVIMEIIYSFLSALLGFAFVAYAVGQVRFLGSNFEFTGSIKEFAPKLIKWLLLTMITLGIYSPWYLKGYMNYYLSNIHLNGKDGELLSRPGKLLKYFILAFLLPVLVLTGIYVFFMARSYDPYFYSGTVAVSTFMFVIFIFLVMIPFIYYYAAWIVNIRYSGLNVRFERSMGSFAGFLVSQILLTIITAGIYYPAAIVKIYRYIVSGSNIYNSEGELVGNGGFEGTAGKGFLLLWGQGLLCIITIGIYSPWAMSKVSNWYLNNTYTEGEISI